MRKMWLLVATMLLCVGWSMAQDAKLAQQYLADGEFEKAVVLFEKLYTQDNDNDYYFDRYIECLMELQRYEDLERSLVKQIRRRPNESRLYVNYGRMYEQQGKEEDARKQYRKAIEQLPKDRYAVSKLANAFSAANKYDLAVETYEKGATMLNDRQFFSYSLADLYRRKGDVGKMIEQYLNSLDAFPERVDNIKSIFQRYLSAEDMNVLQQQLYDRIQTASNSGSVQYIDMLAWAFLQKKDYKNALRQVRALDKQQKGDGLRVYQLAQIASNDKDYDVAIEAYQYVIDKGAGTPFFVESKQEYLRCRRNKLVEGYTYSKEELLELERQYETFINDYGKSRSTAALIMELADLEAIYLNNLDKSITLLAELITLPGITAGTLGQAKLNLGDYYLMKTEVWESTLLYSQVDKSYKDDILGHEARFRNARLAYYSGDFEWAQAQFEILKASTAKLIANDALDMSVFISDNLNLDTTATALEYYAEADMLIFQNRFTEAFSKLDSLIVEYPNHSLEDDVWYLKAKVFTKKRDYAQAGKMYQMIIDNYPDEIRADNSIFALAELYENVNQLNDKEKASKLFEKLFIDFSGSTFAVEARKRYRLLRGDKIQ
ncbi:tetratricopeptide repeat protein [Haliscomenobacter hydrossis]|uniref:Tetratricopeptide TPR_2 repeat-containing protein n=1 Tax=Haliscomenobacter hydrossis (strain ATCC 27775 / DSM 1100 / LMG 10767 / O) TaxID=760192 RepID=F4L5P3_HALH1|nr:tetratricopeptide repeat protein [Haliscomenobacter hydrossis]AEE51878.1 Tetratricopeptide TPR_2 repeat-containing protein [Haliscomenobacter hydrossis DSM 1100]